jgi:hypothetical protein
MQRFYCKVCKRVKRVRHLPVILQNPACIIPEDRIGECDKHSAPKVIRPARWTETNTEQADARFNRMPVVSKKARKAGR